MEHGESASVIARMLGVGRASLYRWNQMAQGARGGLRSKPHPGRRRRMTSKHERQLVELLKKGATAHGWPNDLWTAKRIASMIRRHFGLRYHPEHVRKIMKQRLRWTSQKPERRARERTEPQIERWRTIKFPRIKKRGPTRRQSRLRR